MKMVLKHSQVLNLLSEDHTNRVDADFLKVLLRTPSVSTWMEKKIMSDGGQAIFVTASKRA